MKLPTISVENFGPIRKGTVELRPLTIFTGHSDTGKSWLATLIYSLFSKGNFRSIGWSIENKLQKLRDDLNGDWDFPESIEQWLLESQINSEVTFSEADCTTLSSCMDQVLLNILTDVERCFGLESYKELRRWSAKNETIINVNSSNDEENDPNFYKLFIYDDGFERNLTIPTKLKVAKAGLFSDYLERIQYVMEDDLNKKHSRIRSRLVNIVIQSIYEQNMGAGGSVYLPAGRVGLLESFNILVPAIIERFPGRNLTYDEVENSFPGNRSDFIATLAKARPDRLKFRKRSMLESAKRIEKNLLGGEVIVKPNLYGQPFFYFRPFRRKETIPLDRASSTVTQLASLVIFLRYTINKRDIIVFEEPELDLHPEKQVELIYEIAFLVQDGYKIIVTTHSEWFTEALSNVIAFNGVNDLPIISSTDVGVWNFEFRKNFSGSVISEIEWGVDQGGYQTEFESVSRRLYNQWLDATGDIV